MPPLSPFYNKHIPLPFLDKMANFVSPLHVGLNACETAWHLPHASQESLTFVKLNFINCAATTMTSMCVQLLSSSVPIQTGVYLRLTPSHSAKHLNVRDVCPGLLCLVVPKLQFAQLITVFLTGLRPLPGIMLFDYLSHQPASS